MTNIAIQKTACFVFFLVLSICLLTQSVIAGNTEKDSLQRYMQEPFTIVDHMPTFKGGDKGMIKFIMHHLTYPSEAKQNNIQGKVFIRFIILPDGKIDNVTVVKKVHPLLDAAAADVVKRMPKWKPGKLNGTPVSVWFNLPINFVLN